MAEATQHVEDGGWFYEEDGQRKGAIDKSELIRLINSGKVTFGTSVWKKGFQDWLKVENTELRTHLENIAPPPLTGEHVNNTVVWILAFAPIIGYFLEFFVAGLVSGLNGGNGTELSVAIAVQSGAYWYVTLILNISLSYLDENRLKKAGHDTSKFKGIAWLVPVYLYQRAKNLKQNLAYFVTWIVCFAFILSI